MTPKTSLNRIVVGIWICPLLFCFFWFLPNTHRCTCITPVCSGLCAFCLSRNLICQASRFIYAFTLIIPELTTNHVTIIGFSSHVSQDDLQECAFLMNLQTRLDSNIPIVSYMMWMGGSSPCIIVKLVLKSWETWATKDM